MLSHAGLGSALEASKTSGLPNQSREKSLAQQLEKSVGDGLVCQTRKNQDAHKVARQHRRRVVNVKAGEFVFAAEFRGVQPLLPLGLPAALKHLDVDPINQGLFVGEVVIKQSVGDANAFGQITQLRIKTVTRKKLDCTVHNLTLAVLHRHALARCRSPDGHALRVCPRQSPIYRCVIHG